jgi:hypothetical protein
MTLTAAERLDRLDRMIRENRVSRGEWTEGHDRACLLAALSPEAGAAQTAAACPAELMPPWLAYLTPWLDDAPSEHAWPHIVRRYASLARRWHVLDGEAWDRARIGALIAIVSEARTHTGDDAVALAAIDGVIAWLRRGAPESERRGVEDAAAAAAASSTPAAYAAYAARAAAAARADAAWAARAAETAAYAAAESTAFAAAAAAARAAGAAADAARAAAAEAAADRIAAGVLDAIEREIAEAEASR